MTIRIAAFVDGFNLYNGMHQATGRRDLWLDLESLLGSLVRPGFGLVLDRVHYFTTMVAGDPAAMRRQQDYLDALTLHGTRTTTYLGRFQRKTVTCLRCGDTWTRYEEKETDVAIAARAVEAVATGAAEQVWFVSGDSDLCPAIRSINRIRPQTRIMAMFPPRRSSEALRRAASGCYQIGTNVPAQHQLPSQLTDPVTGRTISRPAHWT